MTENDYKRILKDKEIKYRTTLNLPSNLTFGIEIEYENAINELISNLLYEEELLNKNFSNWINKIEIDLVYNNIDINKVMNGEINSPVLRDSIKTWKNLRIVLNILKENNALITNQCGGHVNIGAHILGNNITYWRNFLLLWILYEKEIYKFSSGEFSKIRIRENGVIDRLTLLLLKNILYISDIDKNKIDIFRYLGKSGVSFLAKKHDVSFYDFKKFNYDLDNRIEFRIPNGSLKEEIWQNYINFFAKFMIACKKELDVDEIVYKINNNDHSVLELADYVFEDNIDKENFLIQTLKTNKIYKKELIPHIEKY